LKVYEPSPKAMEKAMLAAGVDKAYLGWRLKDFSLEKHLDWRCGGYYLSGVQGCGKSCLAAAIVADRMDPNHPQTVAVQKEQFIDRENRGLVWEWPDKALRWFNARELCDYLRDSWGQGGEDKAVRALLKYRLIVIDDIGTERGTANQDAVNLPGIRRVIDKCGHNGIGLVITTNLALSELDDPRMGSRLCDLEEIELPEVDRRAEAKRRRQKLQAKPCGFEKARQ
jgi:DNA replication protein DnaC